MSFSGGGNPGSKGGEGPSFGDNLLSFVQQRFPVAGGIAGAFQGAGHSAESPYQMSMNENPVPQVGGDFVQANAMPKQGGGGQGLSMLMKLFGG